MVVRDERPVSNVALKMEEVLTNIDCWRGAFLFSMDKDRECEESV